MKKSWNAWCWPTRRGCEPFWMQRGNGFEQGPQYATRIYGRISKAAKRASARAAGRKRLNAALLQTALVDQRSIERRDNRSSRGTEFGYCSTEWMMKFGR